MAEFRSLGPIQIEEPDSFEAVAEQLRSIDEARRRDGTELERVLAANEQIARDREATLTARVVSLEALRPIAWAIGSTDGVGGLSTSILVGCTIDVVGSEILMKLDDVRPAVDYLANGINGGGAAVFFATRAETETQLRWRAIASSSGTVFDLSANPLDFNLMLMAETI